MSEFFDAMWLNALLTIPFAVLVSLVARWINRPAAIHVLWIIVLLKLVSPHLYDVRIPGFEKAATYFALPSFSDTGDVDSRLDPDVQVSKFEKAARSLSTRTDNLQWLSGERLWKHLSASPHQYGFQQPTRAREPSVGSTTVATRKATIRRLLIFVWGLGSASFFFILFFRARRFHRFVRRAPLADETIQLMAQSIVACYGLRNSPSIRVASGTFPPLLWVLPGSLSIVLPRKLISDLDQTATRNLLAHELAHFARRDHWVRLLESVVLGICWWNPLAWWARRQLQQAEELCCDAWVTWAFPKSKTEYARTLLATFDYLSDARTALPPLASGLGRVNLIRKRFEMILHHKSPRRLSAIGMAITAMAAVAILPCSPSVLARPHDDTITTPGDPKANVESSVTPGRRQNDGQNKEHANVFVNEPQTAADLHRLIQSAVARGIKEARGGLRQAQLQLSEDYHLEVSRSLKKLSNSDWLHAMSDALEALDSVPDEDIEAIAEHIDTAMEHFGIAIEKSAEAFAQVFETERGTLVKKLTEDESLENQIDSALQAHVIRALESAGLAKHELWGVIDAVEKAIEKMEKHVADQELESKRGKTARTKQTDEQVKAILHQIQTLINQLEQKTETDPHATSTFR